MAIKGIVLDRRRLLAGAAFSIVGACAQFRGSTKHQAEMQFANIEAQLGGRLGVTAVNTENSLRLSHRGGERFAMCSTFKWVLAAAVLARVERGDIALDQRISYSAADLLDVSPVSQAGSREGSLTVQEMCAAIVEVSDNTAANLLLALIGGPSSFTNYLREIGDSVTRLDRNEPGLNANLPGDPRDTTTPDAMVDTMDRLLVGDALSVGGRNRLIDWMKSSRTGLDRLRAGLPSGWIAGDKTGAGANGASNDNAIVWPPGRAPILIAAYLSGSQAPLEARNAAHAQIGRIVSDAF
jgi:beta-lactamase class A